MKTQKMNFKNIKNVLSRSEMKKIMAGSSGGSGGTGGSGGAGGGCVDSGQVCDIDLECCPGDHCITIGLGGTCM